jgi:hypothetical protein
MEAELKRDEAQTAEATAQRAADISDAMIRVDQKVGRLTDAYLDQSLSLQEFRDAKNRLVEEKQTLKDKQAALQQHASNRFEPAIRFINAAKTARIVASNEDRLSQRDFLQKVRSNLTIENRTLRFTPRGAWQLVADHGLFGQQVTGAPVCGAPAGPLD